MQNEMTVPEPTEANKKLDNDFTVILIGIENMGKLIDLTGKKFGRLTVVSRLENDGRRNSRWHCICDCGTSRTVRGDSLKSGRTLSCGCLNKERASATHRTHGMRGSKTYCVWQHMKGRCYNPKNPRFAYYGGRGITVCGRWKNSFENFYADMGDKPEGLTIERIDNNRGYYPKNCKWATQKEQTRNQRSNRMIKYQGKERCIGAWAEELGIRRTTLSYRLNRYPPQIAFNM